MRLLTIEIPDVRPTLCSVAPGESCPHVLTKRMGTVWVCGVFRNEDGSEIELGDDHGDGTGSLMRCQPCLAAEARTSEVRGV